MSSLSKLKQELKKEGSREKKRVLSGFFKTGKGEYGEGDRFIGVAVPAQRRIAAKYSQLTLAEIGSLLSEPIHEYRMTALLILLARYRTASAAERAGIYRFYLGKKREINNWDLVDTSVHKIVGHYLFDKDKKVLYRMAKSANLWERRMAVVATYYFIKHGSFTDTLAIAEMLVGDTHDLIHKAVGWMLREVGKKDMKTLEAFLCRHRARMPRTMLRYAIEKLSAGKRRFYLGK
ncbi:MAG: DNA alkylation repair protein [Elusimicrobia bacterium]|nr:DNA alkylation repair protein [Elusimicrobiota bacterium]